MLIIRSILIFVPSKAMHEFCTHKDSLEKIQLYHYLWHDEFICQQADRRQDTICKKWQGGERIDGCVDICKSLKPLELSFLVAIPYRAVTTKEDLNWTKGPPKYLVEPIRQIDGSWTFKCRSLWHAVYGSPAATMHLETCKDILCNWTINPSELHRQT